jgi:hypothetical protein
MVQQLHAMCEAASQAVHGTMAALPVGEARRATMQQPAKAWPGGRRPAATAVTETAPNRPYQRGLRPLIYSSVLAHLDRGNQGLRFS